jgi:hypothetical protein
MPVYLLKRNKDIPSEKWGKNISYILIISAMKFRNKEVWYGIAAYIGPFRTLAGIVKVI